MSLNQSWALTELRVIFSVAGLNSHILVLICWNQSWRVKTMLFKRAIMIDCNLEHQGIAVSVLITKIIQYWWHEAWKGLVSSNGISAALWLIVSSSQEVYNVFQAIPTITGEMFTDQQVVLTHKHLPCGGQYWLKHAGDCLNVIWNMCVCCGGVSLNVGAMTQLNILHCLEVPLDVVR